MKGKTRFHHVFVFLNIAIPLLLGLFLYLMFRRDSYVSLVLGKYISFSDWPEPAWPVWAVAAVRNFSADIMWAYALTFSVLYTLGYSPKHLILTFAVCLGLIIGVELMQKLGVFHGTFDFLDISLETLSVCLALFVIKKHEEAQNEKNGKST